MKIILASSSPRRKDLMDLAKIEYEAITSNFDEKVDTHLSFEEQSKQIAYGKAKDVFENTQGDRTIIGSDTLVIVNGKQFGKAKTRNEAIEMLQELLGMTSYQSGSEMTDQEIQNYVDSEQPFFCAGAYAIQGFFTVFVDKIEGDYPTALGLPINRVYSILKENNLL